MPTRRSTRLNKSASAKDDEVPAHPATEVEENNENLSSDDDGDDDSDDEVATRRFQVDGKFYDTYQEMVAAKRKRNEDFLRRSGLLDNPLQPRKRSDPTAQQQGLKRRKTAKPTAPRRKSGRLAGTPSDGRYIEDERAGSFVIAGTTGADIVTSSAATATKPADYGGRINDGSPLDLKEAVELCGPKWVQESSVEAAQKFHKEMLLPLSLGDKKRPTKGHSPRSVAVNDPNNTTITHEFDHVRSQVEVLSVDDDNLVAKVTPERIYSVACHPGKDHLIVGAGDKLGHVGLWNVDKDDVVHLFRFHTRPVNTLEWTANGQALLSSSYDGTVRLFDVQKQQFEEIFDANAEMDDHSFYTQYLCRDHRFNDTNGHSFFLSTSMGTAMHIDRRIGHGRGRVTFHAQLSEKKINSLSLHRDGNCLASAGLDQLVKFWDLRKFGSSTTSSGRKKPSESSSAIYKPSQSGLIGEHSNKLSVNSAFFSPSGKYLVTTNMSNALNTYEDAHMTVAASKKSAKAIVPPKASIYHNNCTGRWLTTFMATWHPEMDIFCIGSMKKPRAIDVFDGPSHELLRAISGDSLTAVASRCCFHPATDKMVLVGGNSSGRVTIVR